MDFEQHYQRLNDEQKRAVDVIDGPVMVLAGPGTGKTELLSVRIANILKQTDVLPSSILCLTFTDSAALNMQRRLSKIIGQAAYDVNIHTFHSFGSEIIGRYGQFFYDGAMYQPADELTKIQIMEEIFEGMDHDNPLGMYHPAQGYTYLKESLNKISELKRGGLTPAEYRELLNANKIIVQQIGELIVKFFRETSIRGKKDIALVAPFLKELNNLDASSSKLLGTYSSLASHLKKTLNDAYQSAEEMESTKPITKWKNRYLRKNAKKELILKDDALIDKNLALADVYEKYQELLHKGGFYDFDDMLLDVIKELESNPELKSNLQERFLYVLIDEFQDTSGVQTRLVDNLLDSIVSEGRPNVFAVGDDDQAIFKFQGANLDNILNFYNKYDSPEVILLNKNYRSNQAILDEAQKVIKKGEIRLEDKLENLNKTLVAANNNVGAGEITIKEFKGEVHEYIWIANQIKEIIAKKGVDPKEIAVIGRKHAQLEYIAKILDHFEIPVAYERKKNIFDHIHIQQIITMLRFVDSLGSKNRDEADELLPAILKFSFWEVSQIEAWKISLKAYKEKKKWLEVMLEHEDEKIQNIAQFFITLSMFSAEHTAEEVLDVIIGNRELNISDTLEEQQFISPFKQINFNEETLKKNTKQYLDLLSSLNIFIKSLRAFKGSVALTLKDALEFIDLHVKNKIPLNDVKTLNKEDNAVQLLTAHKAKGQEFEHVFIIGCLNDIWASARNFDKLSFPSNLPLKADPDNEDDMLRIFFVSLTRAKTHLYLTYYLYKENGRETLKLRYLEKDGDPEDLADHKEEEINELLELQILDREVTQISDEQDKLLRGQLKDYQMSVTHLINYLDLIYCGPQRFLEHNLLKFPQMQTPASAYGSAMHKAIEYFYKDYKKTKTLPILNKLHDYFTRALTSQRLNRGDFKKQLSKGKDKLTQYYEHNKNEFDFNDDIEVNFKWQGCNLNGAEITGKIDKIKKINNKIIVYDYKTGKPLHAEASLNDNDKIKLWKYTLQLAFYKLLIENARDYKFKYKVEKGFLEFLDASETDDEKLEHTILNIEIERLKQLIKSVHQKITTLDFPDTSKYSKNYKGIEKFIEDILSGSI